MNAKKKTKEEIKKEIIAQVFNDPKNIRIIEDISKRAREVTADLREYMAREHGVDLEAEARKRGLDLDRDAIRKRLRKNSP